MKKVKPFAVPAAVTVVIILTFIGIYRILYGVLEKSNIDTIREIAAHDEKAIENVLIEEWEALEKIPKTLKSFKTKNEEEMFRTFRMLTQANDGEINYLVSRDGRLYMSNGTIKDSDNLSEYIKDRPERFAVRYDAIYDIVIENRKEYLLLGVRLDGVKIGGKYFDYAVKRLSIRALDNKVKADSFKGEAQSSVIDKTGAYIINMRREGGYHKRENFEDYLSRFKIAGYKNFAALKNEILSCDGGLTVKIKNGGKNYAVYFQKLKDTDWIYITQVPISVFSAQTEKILFVFALMMLIILGCFMTVVYTKTAARKKAEEAETIHRNELQEALSMAQQANRAKTVFLNSMSHDIRTPMNAIIGFTSLAGAHIDDKGLLTDYLAKIKQASEHLLRLINDILDMSRIESGKVIIEEKETDIREIFSDLENILYADVKMKKLDFTVDACGIKNNIIICDKMRFERTMLNIVSNAVKYTPNNGKITLKAVQGPEENGRFRYEFRIKDNGIGMSEEFVKTVFEPFTRARSTTASGIQGTGLGMAISKNMVEMMGGTISCQSRENAGTEFVVSIPFKTAGKISRRSKNNTGKIDFSGKRVLLAEDNALNREIALELLKSMGFSAEACNDGGAAAEALENAPEGYYDLVLMDIQMPGVDGCSAARIIRSLDNKKKSEIPIIAMSANAFSEDKIKAYNAGMNGYISKPIDTKTLAYSIYKILKGMGKNEI